MGTEPTLVHLRKWPVFNIIYVFVIILYRVLTHNWKYPHTLFSALLSCNLFSNSIFTAVSSSSLQKKILKHYIYSAGKIISATFLVLNRIYIKKTLFLGFEMWTLLKEDKIKLEFKPPPQSTQ
jgi:hypothetical protein